MNLSRAFSESAQRHSGKQSLFWGDQELTYGELHSQSMRVASVLHERFSVSPGDRVGLWLKNCPEFVPSLFGIFHCGAVAVPINNFLKPDEVNYVLQDAGINVLITDADLGTHHRALEAAHPSLKLWKVEELSSLNGSTAAVVSNATRTSLAVLIYTSGTTGKPKGAMLSHGNLLHNVESCRIVLQTVEGDRIAVLLPLFHSYMLTVGMLLPLLVGGSMVLVKSLHPVRNALQEIVGRGATILPAIPQFYRSLVNAPGELKLPLRLFISGAAPLPGQVLKEFEARFGVPLIEGYGLSEASPVVTKNPLNGARKPGSVGVPVHDVEVSIQDEQGCVLGPHKIGELCVRGGNVMLGYWNNPAETARALRNGWLLTGDIGYRDEDCYFYITDRKKDMLLVNGINVYPREIEEVIHQFEGVNDAAVIGKPDPRKGEQPVAFVSPRDGVSLDTKSLQLFLRRKLADYKLPRRIVVMPELPRNASGKILKTVLRELPTG